MIGIVEAPSASLDDLQEQLVAALRMELVEYGGLLCYFEAQQDALFCRKSTVAQELSATIQHQIETARASRKTRESLARSVAQAAGCPDRTSLRELASLFRAAFRPLVEALSAEVSRLITCTQRRAQQNQLLLSRALSGPADMHDRDGWQTSIQAVAKLRGAGSRGRVLGA